MKTKSVVASLALGSLVTLSGCATNNPFAAEPMQDGYNNSQKAKEGSCGDKKMEGSCGDKKMEGSCGGKKMEGSCGDKKMEGSCGAGKVGDAKCGDAKCGANK